MKINKALLLLLTLLVGAGLFYLIGGFVLAAVYVLIWIDKIVIINTLKYFGIELTTMATLMLGIAYGPIAAFIFGIVVIPLLHSMRFVLLPLQQPDWPLFVPHPNNVVDALGGAVAGMFATLPFLYLAVAVTLLKDVGYALSEGVLLGKPINWFSAVMYLLVNALIAYQFGPAITVFIG